MGSRVERDLTITRETRVGFGIGPQVVLLGDRNAKFYDPSCYPELYSLTPFCSKDQCADQDYICEANVYAYLPKEAKGSIVPKFIMSVTRQIDMGINKTGLVRGIILEYVRVSTQFILTTLSPLVELRLISW